MHVVCFATDASQMKAPRIVQVYPVFELQTWNLDFCSYIHNRASIDVYTYLQI